jgi:hypothetical protein
MKEIEFIGPHGGAERLLPRQPATALVDIDPQKLDEVWRQDQFGYINISKGYSDESDRAQCNAVSEMILNDSKAFMPVLYTMTGKASEFKFIRGRHEMAVLRDMGYSSVPVIVPADQVKSFKQYLGADKAARF